MLLQCLSMKNKAEVMKEELRARIVDSGSVDLPRKLELVDTLQRLGLDYHYGKEINDLLCGIHDAGDEARVPANFLLFIVSRNYPHGQCLVLTERRRVLRAVAPVQTVLRREHHRRRLPARPQASRHAPH